MNIAINHFNLLQAIPRKKNRQKIQLNCVNLPFSGKDIWTIYELSWLNKQGLPQVYIAKLEIDANSINIIESKSLKIYINSFNQIKFNKNDFFNMLFSDFSKCVCGKINLAFFSLKEIEKEKVAKFSGYCLDYLNIKIKSYSYDKNLLSVSSTKNVFKDAVYSNLFKSNCPITRQPDWASIYIIYSGRAINYDGLLRYLISFRIHNEFHEDCIERIFNDISNVCKPVQLSIYARYTRRGGIDINPWRSNTLFVPSLVRLSRQ